MNQIKENLEARLFCITHLREYYLHQMLSTRDDLRQDSLLILINTLWNESNDLIEALLKVDDGNINKQELSYFIFNQVTNFKNN